ncbi:MAG TPA: hypothetical protein VFH78_12295 [Candidatus Thermoplasmatota archaeon]|nr:hypothetical protein [Candidatus Thermoplasmatota archaeon]
MSAFPPMPVMLPIGASFPRPLVILVPRADLEQAHHQLRTAMTIVRSRGDLLRLHLRDEPDAGRRATTEAHLLEIEIALDRLHDLVLDVRKWHAAGQ